MNSPSHRPRDPWTRLTAAARHWRDERDLSAPTGFATRVAALALSRDDKMASLFDVFALRALGLACLLAVFSVALNYHEISRRLSGSSAGDDLLPPHDTVAVVLALAD